jgi:histidinol-phosphate aminotransferase
MKTINILGLTRPHLNGIAPYSSARDDFHGAAEVFLDANENPFDTGFNRYPDPHQKKIKEKLSAIKGVATDQIFLGNGSDEPIDLLLRAFCEPGKDNIIILPPTYGMYRVSAAINNVAIKEALLDEKFDINVDAVTQAITPQTKIIFLCSPNNPTGNRLSKDRVKTLLGSFNGLVVVDEAYIDFSDEPSLISMLSEYQNLIVLQTLSKAFGLACVWPTRISLRCWIKLNRLTTSAAPINSNLYSRSTMRNNLQSA